MMILRLETDATDQAVKLGPVDCIEKHAHEIETMESFVSMLVRYTHLTACDLLVLLLSTVKTYSTRVQYSISTKGYNKK
jgi:hypothetical protein